MISNTRTNCASKILSDENFGWMAVNTVREFRNGMGFNYTTKSIMPQM